MFNKHVLIICIFIIFIFQSYYKIKKGDKQPPSWLMFILAFNCNFMIITLLDIVNIENKYVKEFVDIALILSCNFLTKFINEKFLKSKLTTRCYLNVIRGFILLTIYYSICSGELELLAVKSAFFIGSFAEFSLEKFDVKALSKDILSSLFSALIIHILFFGIENIEIINKIPWYISTSLCLIFSFVIILKNSCLKEGKFQIRKLNTNEPHKLTKLFKYKDVDEMIAENTRDIENGVIDIFALLDGDKIIGELRVKYISDDNRFAEKGKRAYLYAFRIHKKYQGKGLGNLLLETVLTILAENGYSEFTVGVEDDNTKARYMYEKNGFTEPIARIKESYQGDSYEYDLLLKS